MSAGIDQSSHARIVPFFLFPENKISVVSLWSVWIAAHALQ